jgi:microcystin degradation protein MlrC
MTKSPIRIAVLHFSHETVTFLQNDTTIDDFVYPGSPARGEALLESGPKSYMGGFVLVAREYDDVELIGIESPLWPRTGTGSGWVTQDAYETFVGRMIAQITTEGPFDGVYLCVHGAMAARGIPRPEAELARRVRAAVGARTIIAATFDPHGNEDKEFLRYADLAFCGKYFPHYDSHLQGERAARMLVRAIPRFVPAGTCHGEGADHIADGGAMDRRIAMDGPGAARADLGGARAGRVCQRVFWLPVVGRAGRRHDVPGDHQRRCDAGATHCR